MLTLLGGSGFGLAVWALPAPLVLPAFSAAAVLAALAVALSTARAPASPQAPRLTYRDLSGGLALIGIAAALLSDPEQVLPLVEARNPR